MKRMTEKMAQQMLTFFADRLDINNLPPDDVATFELFQRADTDGILMMESDWDKYDLRQICAKQKASSINIYQDRSVPPFG